MTATAPVSHFMMDAPGLNDQMELTSDHPDATENVNVDDFDIDLDLMQDQVPDNDVIVDDALPVAEDLEEAPGHLSDGQDADMLDEDVPEEHPPTNAPYEQYQEGYNQTEGAYYDNNNFYEAEMVDGFEEEMGTPLPNNDQSESVIERLDDTNREDLEVQPPKSPENEQIHIESTKPSEATGISGVEADHTQGENLETQAEQEEAVDQESRAVHEYSNTEQQEFTNQKLTDTAHHIEHEPNTTSGGDEQTVTESEALQVADETAETGVASDKENTEQGDSKQEYQDEDQPSEVINDLPSLPAIKVLYQDNEISLFPPREGDSSETFFLEDEGLGSESLAELLKACRQVLGDHIAEGEELTFDIESLDLHLTEESPHTCSITLFQIVEVYLHLCHNDGLDALEPLYINLDTKINFLTEFSNLVTAAHDGYGLSSLSTGDELDHRDTSGQEYHDGKIRSPEHEVHGEIQAPESKPVEHDAKTSNVADQPQGEAPDYQPQDEAQDEYLEQHEVERFEEPQEEPLNEIQEAHTGQAEYSQDYVSDTEVPADREPHEPHPADLETVEDYDEQVSNAGEGSFEAKEPVESGIVGDDSEQISGVENGSREEPQPIESTASGEEELGAGTTTDENQTNNEAEQPAEAFENAAVSDAISSHSLSSRTAGNIDNDGGNLQQGEEIQDEQDDDIDLGYGDGSAGLDANITVADESNEQEEPRDKLENPASPKEDMFEFEDQDYESPGTLGQASTAQSAVDQEFNHETDVTGTHPEGFFIEENQGEEPVAESSEGQGKHSPIHNDRQQDEIDAFDEDGQYDESVNPNENDGPHRVEVPSLESGECSPSPQKDSENVAIQQDDFAFKTDEAADSAVSSHHREVEPVEMSGLQADDQIIAKTPDPLDGIFEIDEDLFKSPTKELDNNNPPAGETTSVPSAGRSYSKNDAYDSDEIDFDDDDDAIENTKELDTFEVPGDSGDQISNNGSQSAKRSREEEDEVNISENTPDVKRRRSQ